jgi:hypothetical protein
VLKASIFVENFSENGGFFNLKLEKMRLFATFFTKKPIRPLHVWDYSERLPKKARFKQISE